MLKTDSHIAVLNPPATSGPPRLTRAPRNESTELASLGNDYVRRRLVYLSEYFLGIPHSDEDRRDQAQYTAVGDMSTLSGAPKVLTSDSCTQVLNGIFAHDTNGRWTRFYGDTRAAHLRLMHLTEEEADAEDKVSL